MREQQTHGSGEFEHSSQQNQLRTVWKDRRNHRRHQRGAGEVKHS